MAITDLIPWKRESKDVMARQEDEDPFYSLQREMNRLFDDFFGGGSSALARWDETRGPGMFNPRLDITETDKEIKVAAELPGLDEKDLEVKLSGNALTISGEKKAEQEDKGQNYYRMERSFGSFYRTIPLPDEVETDKVDARFKNGVLNISLPRKHPRQEKIKKIAVKHS